MTPDLLRDLTAVLVAVIAAGGALWATIISRKVTQTRATTSDTNTKVNGRLDQLLAENERLRGLLFDYLEREIGRHDDSR